MLFTSENVHQRPTFTINCLVFYQPIKIKGVSIKIGINTTKNVLYRCFIHKRDWLYLFNLLCTYSDYLIVRPRMYMVYSDQRPNRGCQNFDQNIFFGRQFMPILKKCVMIIYILHLLGAALVRYIFLISTTHEGQHSMYVELSHTYLYMYVLSIYEYI